MIELSNLPYVQFVRELAQARHIPIIVVGGAVRDALLGRPVHDLDFAVQGNAVNMARLVADRLNSAFYLMDAERGTARVIVLHEGQIPFHLDFAVCRGADWTEDLFGRDFSINAIAYDLAGGTILDPTGGQADLPQRVIRQTNRNAVADDPVRALRAVRIAHALQGIIESDTEAAVRRAASQLSQPSRERVRDELLKTLALPHAARAVRQLDELGLLAAIIPEIEAMRTCEQSLPHTFTVLEHTFVVLEYLDKIIEHVVDGQLQGAWLQHLQIAEPHRQALGQQLLSITANDRVRVAVFRLAALLHDVAKPGTRSVGADGTRSVHFYGHEDAGVVIATTLANALKLSGEEVDQLRTTVRHHMRPNQMSRDSVSPPPTPRAIYRFMNVSGLCAPEIALFCIADGMGKAGPDTVLADANRRADIASLLIQRYYERFSPAVEPKPLLTGNDILAMGVKQGPQIGHVLGAVREAQMVGEIETYESALQLARQLVAEHSAEG